MEAMIAHLLGAGFAAFIILLVYIDRHWLRPRQSVQWWRILRLAVWVVGGGLLLAVVLLPGPYSFARHGIDATRNYWSGEPARSELRALYAQIELGQSEDDVRHAMTQARTRFLKLDEVRNSGNIDRRLMIWTPYQWGGLKNWVLFVRFREGRVVEVHIGTMDTWQERPAGAPEDKVDPQVRQGEGQG